MKTLCNEYPLKTAAEAVGIARTNVYRKIATGPRAIEDAELIDQIRDIFFDHRQCYGSPRIHLELKRQGIVCSENRVARLMRETGLVALTPRRKTPRTTDSRHGGPIAPNHVKTLDITHSYQVWAMDITYIRTNEGWVYLAAVLDLFLHKIVGWEVSDRIDSTLTERALQRATQQHDYPAGVIVHSDRGSQYASEGFIRLTDALGYIRSMSAKGNCYDNAAMESFFGVAKREDFNRWEMLDIESARARIFDYIETYYNRSRIHSTLGMTPLEFEQINQAEDTENEFLKASAAPSVESGKAGAQGLRPRPMVAASDYPLQGCSPAEPCCVSSDAFLVNERMVQINNEKEDAKID